MPPSQPYHENRVADLRMESMAFEKMYLNYFTTLHKYAFNMVHDRVMAEEMVHQVFWKLLERKDNIQVHTSLKAYLYRSVHYECLNYLKHEKVKQEHMLNTMKRSGNQADDAADDVHYKELQKQLKVAINELPEQCRTIFQLSRFEELKYAEIASQLGLSIKTVETQMSRALKKLRIQLAEYLPLILWMLMNSIIFKH